MCLGGVLGVFGFVVLDVHLIVSREEICGCLSLSHVSDITLSFLLFLFLSGT